MPAGTLAMVVAILGAAVIYLGAAALSRNTAFMEILELGRTLRSRESSARNLPSGS
jgi:hypothetical protein